MLKEPSFEAREAHRYELKFISINSEFFGLIMFRNVILDILADAHSFKGDFAHQLIVGMPDSDRNKLGVSFAFEYTKLLKQNLLNFIGIRSY